MYRYFEHCIEVWNKKPDHIFYETASRFHSMWSGFWFHTSMQSSKNRYIPYNLGLKIVNNKTIWYVTTLFSISSHLFTGKPTMTSSCLPAKWRRRHRACILSCYHYWNQKHWPTLTNHRKAMEMKTNKTKLLRYENNLYVSFQR